MTTSRDIGDPRILGWKIRRDPLEARRRNRGTGGRLLKNRTRALPGLEPLEARQMLASYSVTSSSDLDQAGTLRFAIFAIDGGTDQSNTITFNLPANQHIIVPGSSNLGPLPSITRPVNIEGNSQPGFSGAPLIQISGGFAGFGATCLDLEAGSSGSVIQSLEIGNFATGYGIIIRSSNDSVIGNDIGTDASGKFIEANNVGFEIYGSDNTIGGASAGAGNVISGNNEGLAFLGTSCLIEGNRIGTDVAGTLALANGTGVYVGTAGAHDRWDLGWRRQSHRRQY